MVSPNTPSSSQTIIDNFLSGNYQTTDSTNPYLVPVTPYTPPADPTIPDCGALYPDENRIYDPLSSSCVIVPEEDMTETNANDNKGNIEGKNITDGVIDGYERVLSNRPIGIDGSLNSREMMALENRFGPEIASQMGLMNQEYLGRGIQYNPITGRYIAASPNASQFAGDIKRGFGDIFGGLKNFATQGGLLGILLGSKQSPEIKPNYYTEDYVPSRLKKDPFIPPVITNDNIAQENIASLEQQQLIDDVLKSNNNKNNNNNNNNNFGGINTSKKKSTPKNTFTREYNQSKQGNPFERNA